MKLKLIQGNFTKVIEVTKNTTLKEIYLEHIGKRRPTMVQVGGALGKLYRKTDVQKTMAELKFYEDSIAFYYDFCPVDFSRFMIRFLIRELNIVNDDIRKLYDVIDGLTNHKTSSFEYGAMMLLLEKKTHTLGEQLLFSNIHQLLDWYEDDFKSHLSGYCKLGVCRGLIQAQCINACPAHIHIPGFVALMKEGDYNAAYKLMRQENPLSAVCGSICARPCEDRCRRGEITGTVGVRALQRFISSKALEDWDYDDECLEDNHKRIAIVGGGPCGLTAAYYLRRTGYQVTIYEKHKEAGGMLSFGVPLYRLPSEAIRNEINTIEKLGVKIKTNTEVGKDIELSQIKKDHDAVLISTGRPIGLTLNLDHEQVYSGIDFLKSVHLKQLETIGSKVVVIGGGDVAMDCARTARRLRADVSVISLESAELMPASVEEKIQATEEGVHILNGLSIDRIEGKKLFLKKCIQVYDDEGAFKPTFASSDEVIENVDAIVCAVGQKSDLSFVDDDENLYFAGDVVSATIVIDAIAKGKSIAAEMDAALGGKGLHIGRDIKIPERVLNIRTFDDDLRMNDTLNIKDRILNFDQVNKNYTVEDAVYEASRCMRCDRNSVVSLQLGR